MTITGLTPYLYYDDAGGRRTLLIVHVDDVDAQHARVTEATGAELEAPMDQPYGPCTFTVTDPWGYAWCFWQGQATPPDDAIP
jgi:uncharacterized glyoxalase superfamily protein PhnB